MFPIVGSGFSRKDKTILYFFAYAKHSDHFKYYSHKYHFCSHNQRTFSQKNFRDILLPYGKWYIRSNYFNHTRHSTKRNQYSGEDTHQYVTDKYNKTSFSRLQKPGIHHMKILREHRSGRY